MTYDSISMQVDRKMLTDLKDNKIDIDEFRIINRAFHSLFSQVEVITNNKGAKPCK